MISSGTSAQQSLGTLTGGPSYRFVGYLSGTIGGLLEKSSNSLASWGPLNERLLLPHTCHQKFSKRRALGSRSRRAVVVYTERSCVRGKAWTESWREGAFVPFQYSRSLSGGTTL